MMHRALFSVAPFEAMLDFGAALTALGWEIIATHDACQALCAAGIAAIDVAEFNGVEEQFDFPPTLHPRMEQALTGSQNAPRHIDLVFDIPYGIEIGNDVGGLTLLALAAKGNRIPISSIDDMRSVISELEQAGVITDERRSQLIAKTNAIIAKHYLGLASINSTAKPYSGLILEQTRILENGENPYQQPAFLGADTSSNDPLAVHRFRQAAGPAPCFTNLADLDSIIETLAKLRASLDLNQIQGDHIAVAAKHGNACGLGISSSSQVEAVEMALFGDPLSIWGGELVIDGAIDETLATHMTKSDRRRHLLGNEHWMLDMVIACDASPSAITRLCRNPRRKIMLNKALAQPTPKAGPQLRSVRGGALLQPAGDYVLDLGKIDLSGQPVDSEQQRDLCIAWAVASTANVGGNEVALAKAGKLLALGGGPSTVQAAQMAVQRAQSQGFDTRGAVFAADAFFPVADAPAVLTDAGCSAGVVPAGGAQHASIVTHMNTCGVSVAFLPEDVRGFCRH